MLSLAIRRGTAADALALSAFGARLYAETFGKDNRPEDLALFLASSYGVPQQTSELISPDVTTLLAHRGTTLIGYAQVRRKVAPPCVTQLQPIELHRFYVDQPEQGRGVASELMAESRAAAVMLGGLHLWLSVWERNARAIAFYRKAGFVDVGSTDFYVGADRQTDRVLVAALGSVES